MKRVKVALDANIPPRLARMLQTTYGDQGFEFIHETRFAPGDAEDEFWAVAFKRFGGSVVVTGDKNIAKRPHQIAAFKQEGLVCFFCGQKWAEADLPYKAAHLVFWWPFLEEAFGTSSPGDCWWVPMQIKETQLKEVKLPSDVLKKAGRKRSI